MALFVKHTCCNWQRSRIRFWLILEPKLSKSVKDEVSKNEQDFHAKQIISMSGQVEAKPRRRLGF